jgi:hypothetical protein
MLLPFENVREQLLRAGIAPRHAGRYVTELREHLADLTARQRTDGHSAKEAAERARALLGTDTELAEEMIARGAPRSLTARAPWAVFALLPVVAIFLLITAIGYVMLRIILLPVHALNPLPSGGYQTLVMGVSFVASYLVGPVFAAGCIALALRQRLSSNWVWVGLALVAMVSAFLGFYSPPGAPYTLVPVVHVNGHISAAATFAVVGARALVLFTLAAMAYHTLRTRLPAAA